MLTGIKKPRVIKHLLCARILPCGRARRALLLCKIHDIPLSSIFLASRLIQGERPTSPSALLWPPLLPLPSQLIPLTPVLPAFVLLLQHAKHTPLRFPPQGLCTCYSFCRECPSLFPSGMPSHLFCSNGTFSARCSLAANLT